MQTTSLFDNLKSWAEVKVIGVAQDDLRLDVVFYLVQVNAFYAAYRANGHENRSFNLTMVCRNNPSTGATMYICMYEVKSEWHKIISALIVKECGIVKTNRHLIFAKLRKNW